MWEQIRANKRKSVIVVIAMALLLAALGFFIGQTYFPGPAHPTYAEDPGHGPRTTGPDFTGGLFGVMVALAIWLFMTLISYFAGADILLASSGARQIQKEDNPQLFNVVEEIAIAARLPKVPAIYIMDDMAVNAFATGRDPRHAAVTVTAGLLSKLNRDQLQGVIAHEIGHIYNRDVLFMQMLGVMAGAIVLIADTFTRGLWYSGGRRRSGRSSSDGDGGKGQAIFMVIAIVLAILAPILAQIIFLAASRRREYLADAQAAIFTRYPEGLASALEVIAGDPVELDSANRVTAPMYISNPFKGMSARGLLSTHPPIDERIRILRGMAGAATFGEYQRASQALGAAVSLPASALVNESAAPIREAHPDAQREPNPRQQRRDVGDMLRTPNKFKFLQCSCGVRVKLPPEFTKRQVECPRCHNVLDASAP